MGEIFRGFHAIFLPGSLVFRVFPQNTLLRMEIITHGQKIGAYWAGNLPLDRIYHNVLLTANISNQAKSQNHLLAF